MLPMSRKLDGFGERLQKAVEHGKCAYSQQAIANRLGEDVDRRKVDGWMKGSHPRPDLLYRIADEFGVDPRWLATGAGKMVVDVTPVAPSEVPPEARDIALAWMRLTPTRQHAIREWVFLESVIAQHYPWLMPGRPPGQSYVDYEKSVEKDILLTTRHLMMQQQEGKP